MTKHAILLATAAFALGHVSARLSGQADAAEPFRRAVLEADRAFDRDVATGGAKAWASYFAPDGKMFRANATITQGRAEIEQLMAPFFGQPDVSLRWQPTFADASASGDLGYTTGESTTRGRDEQGRVVESRGRYVTIWKRQTDGSWKVALDIGANTPPRPVQ
jgi:ketosteroid isomerase-like protein